MFYKLNIQHFYLKMNNKQKVLVFTATYNERENIEELIIGIRKNLPESSILIIDDNSPDKTKELVENLQSKNQNLYLIVREKKLGLDTAHKLAYEYALKNDYNYLITMDADLSHDPRDLVKILENLEISPFVIGSRYMKGGKCLMTGWRLNLSKYGNLFIKKVSGINCNEFTTSFRGFDLKKLDGFNLNKVNAKGYSFMMGTLFEIQKKKFPIKEIPIIFQDRTKGKSKIPRIEILRTFKNLFFLTIEKYFR